jgi:hypothetical protein
MEWREQHKICIIAKMVVRMSWMKIALGETSLIWTKYAGAFDASGVIQC